MSQLFFCHIPKTAGTSLRRALEELYEPWQIVPDLNMIKRQGGIYPEIDLVALTCIRQHKNISLLRGHYHLSCSSLLEGDKKTIVLLRDPVNRTISHLKHMVANFKYPIEKLIKSLDKGELPLPDNVQSRYICGDVDAKNLSYIVKRHHSMIQSPIDDISRFRDEAIISLSSIDFLGTVENIDSFVKKLSPHVPGRSLKIEKLNKSVDIDLDLKSHHIDLIRERNLIDIELHSLALRETAA